MIDSLPASTASPAAPEGDAAALAAVLGPDRAALADLLLAHCLRRGLGLAVKCLSDGRYAWANDAFAALARRDAASVVGADDGELFPGLSRAALRAAEQTALVSAQGAESEHRLDDGNGVAHEYSVLRLALDAAGAHGEPRFMAALWTEVGSERARTARLAEALGHLEQHQRQLDVQHAQRAGAGTPLEDLMRREFDLSSREHREFALVLVSLDAPERHEGEARVRIEATVARLLRERTRAMDASCALGGGRFAVLLSGVGLATAHARVESLRRQWADESVVHEGRERPFTVSMGVASYPHTADAPEALLDAAEQALAAAAARGGDQVGLAAIRFDAE